jgi:hypothetical protein
VAEAAVVGQLQLQIAAAPGRVLLALGPLALALSVEEARTVIADLTRVTGQVAAQLVVARPEDLPPLGLNGGAW